MSNLYNLKTEEGAQNLASLVTVGVPAVNLLVAGYLFVGALIAANGGGEMTVSTEWAVAATIVMGVVLATLLFALAARARRADREQSARRAAAAKRVLAQPVPRSVGPTSVTLVVRPPRARSTFQPRF